MPLEITLCKDEIGAFEAPRPLFVLAPWHWVRTGGSGVADLIGWPGPRDATAGPIPSKGRPHNLGICRFSPSWERRRSSFSAPSCPRCPGRPRSRVSSTRGRPCRGTCPWACSTTSWRGTTRRRAGPGRSRCASEGRGLRRRPRATRGRGRPSGDCACASDGLSDGMQRVACPVSCSPFLLSTHTSKMVAGHRWSSPTCSTRSRRPPPFWASCRKRCWACRGRDRTATWRGSGRGTGASLAFRAPLAQELRDAC